MGVRACGKARPRAAVAVAIAIAGCAVAEPVGSRTDAVVGGRSVTELWGEVAVFVGPAGRRAFFCSGVLVARDVVLTGGHCVWPLFYEGRFGVPMLAPDELAVVAGTLDVSRVSQDALVGVARVVVHPEFQPAEVLDHAGSSAWLYGADDLALLFLARPVAQSPVPLLASADLDVAIDTGFVVRGFGDRGRPGSPWGVLYEADVEVLELSDREMFLRGPTGADGCAGDSGGPAYAVAGGAPRLAGILSRGDADLLSECGAGSVYGIVPAYSAWVQAETDAAQEADGCSITGASAGSVPWPLFLVLVGSALRTSRRRPGHARPTRP